MSGPINISKVERLRIRDKGLCWLCDKPINFKAEPNSDGAPSIEHLIPKCREGSNQMENLVLCHPPCNRRLRDLPLVEKIKLRDEVREQKWLAQLRRRILSQLMG